MKQCKVAILTWWSASFHRETSFEIMRAFDEDGRRDLYKPQVVNMHHDIALLNRYVNDLLREGVEIFVPIGSACSIATKEIIEASGAHASIIFARVYDPVTQGLVDSLEKPGSFTTGIFTQASPLGEIALSLESLYPRITSLLIPYTEHGEAGWLRQHVKAIRDHLTKIGMMVRAIPLDRGTNFFEIIKQYADTIDGICMLEGGGFADQLNAISYFCWENKKFFCAAGTYALQCGTTAAYGGPMYPYGHTVVKLVRGIWEHKRSPAITPVTVIPHQREFIVNESMLRMIDFSDDDIQRLKSNPKIRIIREWIPVPGS